MNKKKYKRIVLLFRVSSILLGVILLVALIIYNMRVGHFRPMLVFTVAILNIANPFIRLLFRKSVIKRELFGTLTILTFVIISFF